MNINNRLRLIRKALKFNQSQMAEKLGFASQSGYSRLENGESDLQDGVKIILENIYNVNIQWLLTGDGEMFLPKKQEYAISIVSEPPHKYTTVQERIDAMMDTIISQQKTIHELVLRLKS